LKIESKEKSIACKGFAKKHSKPLQEVEEKLFFKINIFFYKQLIIKYLKNKNLALGVF
jgi:hypothetical protein